MPPFVRYATLNRYVELSRDLGVDPASLMRVHGLNPAGLANPDHRIPAVAAARLLDETARLSGHDDFGLRLAELRQISTLGPLSLVLREEPDVRSALTLLLRYEHSYNEALRMVMTEQNELATIRLRLDFGEPIDSRQSLELGIGALHGILREFLPAEWRAVSVSFPHPPPKSPETHERVLGPNVAFDQEFAGIVLLASDLDTPIATSDPQLRDFAQQFLRSLGTPRDATLRDRVREMIELLLPAGRCSAAQVAGNLGMDRRTLHRRLERQGETFSSILDSTRADMAERFLLTGRYSMSDIALMLGFSAPSGLSRWFRHHYHCSPTAWLAERSLVPV
jgi:AraC-like DNA-binding protein